MLEFINSNGVLFSGICSIIVALISVIVSVWRDNKKNRTDTIRSLRKELDETKEELEKTNAKILELSSVEKKERNIDKTHGSIYYENYEDGGSRTICGYCWEMEHLTLPVVKSPTYDEYTNQEYYEAYCPYCKNHCREEFTIQNDNDLEPLSDIPF